MQYDRQRLVKDALLERIAATCVDVSSVGQTMLAALASRSAEHDREIEDLADEFGDEAAMMVRVIAAVLRGHNDQVTELWPALRETLAGKSLLYVPLSKEGNTRQIVAARCRQCQLQDLLAWLPRRGLWLETCQLIETARGMERNNPVGPGAVTEFDELFKVGYRALVENLVIVGGVLESRRTGHVPGQGRGRRPGRTDRTVAVQLAQPQPHAASVGAGTDYRQEELGPAGTVHPAVWGRAVHAAVFQPGQCAGHPAPGCRELARPARTRLGRRRAAATAPGSRSARVAPEAIDHLSLILEAILENYGEYRDYNSTTTQSDRGDMLYTLLDFLRLRTEYDRVCWHLKPVILAHEILVSRHQDKAARLWRRALTDRIGQEAEQYLTRLRALQESYAIRMSTVADRIAERFVRPMTIDRMRALVRPAMQEARRSGPKHAFELLEHETQALAGESTGIGFDVPVWLLALEEEVDRAREPTHRRNFDHEIACAVPTVALSREEIRRQLDACAAD